MTNREVMKMALGTLIKSQPLTHSSDSSQELMETIRMLRQALAQPEQEPVWCGCGDGIVANDEAMCGVCVMRLKDQIKRLKVQPEQEPVAWIKPNKENSGFLITLYEENGWTPLYTAPVSKPWVSLTGDEIDDIAAESGFGYINVARAIEAALRSKNT